MTIHQSEGGFRFTTMSYDPLCEDLARYFLADKATHLREIELAQVIQDAIEAYLDSLH